MSKFFAALLVFLSAGCSYTMRRGALHVQGISTQASSGNTKIFVPVVDNVTVRTGIEVVVTNAIRDKLAAADGIDVVNSAEAADFYLLGNIVKYNDQFGPTTVVGNPTTSAAGGLGVGKIGAADIQVTLGLSVRLLVKLPDTGAAQRLLWNRKFERSGTFASSTRFASVGNGIDAGSSSAMHINSSRELIQIRLLSDLLAQQILDQVAQDF